MTRLYNTRIINLLLSEHPISRKLSSDYCMYSNYTEFVNSKDTQTVATGSGLSCWQMYLK